MGAAVVFGFHPGHEQSVEFQQCRGVVDPGGREVLGGGVGDLDEELLTHRPEEPFDLAPSLRPAGRGMHQSNTEFRARPQQPRVDERRAVVDIDRGRHAAGSQRRFEGGGQAHGVLGEPEPVPDHQPRMVVEEGEQVGFAVSDPRPVQGVADPQLVGVSGFEPAEHRRLFIEVRADQLAAAEMA